MKKKDTKPFIPQEPFALLLPLVTEIQSLETEYTMLTWRDVFDRTSVGYEIRRDEVSYLKRMAAETGVVFTNAEKRLLTMIQGRTPICCSTLDAAGVDVAKREQLHKQYKKLKNFTINVL